MKKTTFIFLAFILVSLQLNCRTNYDALEMDDPLNKLSNTQIVFSSVRETWYCSIYTMRINGDDLIQLTDESERQSYPLFTPDGANIIFIGSWNDQNGIFMIPIENREEARLICSKTGHFPQISPDGRYLVMQSQGLFRYDIFLIDIMTGNIFNLTNTDSFDQFPHFSPDGKEIVFTSERDGNNEIYLIDLDGNNLRNLSNNPAGDGGPIFTPDGNQILFCSDRDGNAEVYIMNKDGSNQINLTNHPAEDCPAAISPDGSTVLFLSLRDGTIDIYSMDITGNHGVNHTKSHGNYTSPRYLSNGEMICFTSGRNGLDDIFIMNSDGSNQRNLTKTRNRSEPYYDIITR